MTQNIENKRVKELRGYMSLKEFALPLNVTAVTISKIETGENGLSTDMAKKICKAYNVSMAWLFGESDERQPTTLSRVEKPLADYKLLKENADLQKMVIELQNKLINKQTTELESLKNGESAVAK
jgi:transcriptional regulator with XRE-family HTH domain